MPYDRKLINAQVDYLRLKKKCGKGFETLKKRTGSLLSVSVGSSCMYGNNVWLRCSQQLSSDISLFNQLKKCCGAPLRQNIFWGELCDTISIETAVIYVANCVLLHEFDILGPYSQLITFRDTFTFV